MTAGGDWLDRSGSGQELDVVKLLDSKCGDGIAQLVDTGALVSLGKTSDGGALGVTVTVDGRFRRDYFRNEDELLSWLAEAVPAVQAARGTDRPSGVQGGGSRRRKTL